MIDFNIIKKQLEKENRNIVRENKERFETDNIKIDDLINKLNQFNEVLYKNKE